MQSQNYVVKLEPASYLTNNFVMSEEIVCVQSLLTGQLSFYLKKDIIDEVYYSRLIKSKYQNYYKQWKKERGDLV